MYKKCVKSLDEGIDHNGVQCSTMSSQYMNCFARQKLGDVVTGVIF